MSAKEIKDVMMVLKQNLLSVILGAVNHNGFYDTIEDEENVIIEDITGDIYLCNLTHSEIICTFRNGKLFLIETEEEDDGDNEESLTQFLKSVLPKEIKEMKKELPEDMIEIVKWNSIPGKEDYEFKIPYIDDEENLTQDHLYTKKLNLGYPGFCESYGDDQYEDSLSLALSIISDEVKDEQYIDGYERIARCIRLIRRYNTYSYIRRFIWHKDEIKEL